MKSSPADCTVEERPKAAKLGALFKNGQRAETRGQRAETRGQRAGTRGQRTGNQGAIRD